ncbi:MAG TPA: penicillin-binding transpeptidase domain-containing protein [Terracidiphilus sp.]|jgi:cell division protein FtsI (penicillin-binding protein 3)|nr:penicillin-binding transpeptidase domain-containing protein [Terracidiphilus sp.]
MQVTLRANRNRNTTPRAMPLKLARFWLVCLFFFLWALAITGRLFWLQIVHHHEYVERAEKQQERAFEVAPRRGVLYDRNLRELAATVQVDSIYAVPTEIDDKKAAAHILASIVHVDPEDKRTTEHEIADRLDNGHSFAWVARRVRPEVAARLRALNMKGIYFQKEFQRFFPDNQLAAQVLGYVGLDDNGLGGLEQKFDGRLHGVPGRVFTAMDARRHVLGSTEHEPEPGQNLELTIDNNIQFMAEQALDHAMQKTHADNGTIVVQDVHTGQILALAIRPTFDPNDFRHTTPALLKDHAVSDVYEPGSVFKLVTYSSALDAKVTKPDDMIDCQGGKITLAGRVIHDNQGEHLGVVTVHKALEESSDVAAVKLALKVGQDNFYKYVRAFGFGSRSGIELPGETRGLLRPTSKWNGSSIGSIAIGQEVGVTPIQLVSMVSTIANGGVYLPPRILMPNQLDPNQKTPVLQAAAFKSGEDLPNPLPPGAHRVISEMAAAQMRKMMEGVVLFGTGKPAQLNGYSSGGKTGTAQKVDPVTHLYSKTMHIASFAGIAPVNNPAIAVAVIVDNPRSGPSYYGTAVSAPVFAEVAQQVLEYLGVPHDIDIKQAKSSSKPEPVASEDDSDADQNNVNALFAAVNDLPPDDPLRAAPQPQNATQTVPSMKPQITQSEKVGTPGAHSDPAEKQAASTPQSAPSQITISEGRKLTVPSLIGLPVRKVIETAAAAGLDVQITGSGTARTQAPAPGTEVPPGTKIVVRCQR